MLTSQSCRIGRNLLPGKQIADFRRCEFGCAGRAAFDYWQGMLARARCGTGFCCKLPFKRSREKNFQRLSCLRGSDFHPTPERVRDINRCSHERIFAYLCVISQRRHTGASCVGGSPACEERPAVRRCSPPDGLHHWARRPTSSDGTTPDLPRRSLFAKAGN